MVHRASSLTLVDESQGLTLDLDWLKDLGQVYTRSYSMDSGPGGSSMQEYLTGRRQVPAGYTGIIGKALYSYEGESGVLVNIDPGDSGFIPEQGKRYLIHGELVDSSSYDRAVVVTDFYEGCEQSPWVSFESYQDPVFTDSIFTDYAQKYEQGNNYIQVEASDDISALEPFQQGPSISERAAIPRRGRRGCAP